MSRSPTPTLRIEITPSIKLAVERWCERFIAADLHWWDEPKLDCTTLVINSFDVPNFLRTANELESSQMDVHRLKRAAISALDAALARARSTTTKNALRHARTWVEEAPLGEWQGNPIREERKKRSSNIRFKTL